MRYELGNFLKEAWGYKRYYCWGTAVQARRSRVRFEKMSLEFFIDIILPAAIWPWGWLKL